MPTTLLRRDDTKNIEILSIDPEIRTPSGGIPHVDRRDIIET
jgi:hypothetical protein